ncbi:MAG TPA: hypothetical protein VFN68_14000 [Acidimicrobiales bacterium]|nr:hypothetical protein [Acidimicrobiales bacterium]
MAAVERPQLRLSTLRASRAVVTRDPLVRNSVFLMATTVANSLLGFAYWVVAARLFPTSTIGLAAAFIAAFSMAAMIANPAVHSGLTQALPRSGSGPEWSALVNGGLILGTAASVVIGALVGVILPVVSPEFASVTRSGLSFAGFVAGVVGVVAGIIVDYTFVAERSSGVMFVRNVAFGVAKIPLLFVALAVSGRHSSTGIWGGWVAATLVTIAAAVVVGFPYLGRGYRFVVEGGGRRMRALVRDLAGHHVTNLGCLLPMYVMPVEVVARVSSQANAYFYVTWMLCSLFFMVSPSVASSLFAEGSHDPAAIRRTALRSARITGLLLVAPMAGYLLLGRFVLGIYGAGYARNGTGLLMVLVASAVPDAVTNLYVSVLRVERRLVESSVLNVGMAVIAIVGAWLLLPPLGIVGAGLAWLIAQSAGTVWTLLWVWRREMAAVPA